MRAKCYNFPILKQGKCLNYKLFAPKVKLRINTFCYERIYRPWKLETKDIFHIKNI